MSEKMVFSVGPEKGTPESDYTTDKDGFKYMKRKVVAFKGKCVVTAAADDFWGGDESRPYRSRMMDSPTWGQLFNCAKAQQKRTLDWHHAFFEGACKHGPAIEVNGEMVQPLRLVLGS